jgi:hypothetical protein
VELVGRSVSQSVSQFNSALNNSVYVALSDRIICNTGLEKMWTETQIT